jgi:hypothetical protein
VHAAVACLREVPGRIDDVRKSRLQHRTVHRDEGRNSVRCAIHRGSGHLRIDADERIRIRARTRSAGERLGMARAATRGVVAGAQSVAGFAGQRSIDGIDLDESIESVVEILELRSTQRGER